MSNFDNLIIFNRNLEPQKPLSSTFLSKIHPFYKTRFPFVCCFLAVIIDLSFHFRANSYVYYLWN